MCIIKPMRSLFILYCTVVDLTGLFLTCVGSILLGVLYQVVKCLRQYAHRRYRVKERYVNVYNQTQNSYMCTCRLLPSQRDVRPCILSDPKQFHVYKSFVTESIDVCSGIGRPITSYTVYITASHTVVIPIRINIACIRCDVYDMCVLCCRGTIKSREHGLQTLLYFVQMTSSYVLMLIIMTFNIWVFVSAIAGLGLGYFLCGWAYPEMDNKMTCPDSCNNEETHRHGNGDTEQELKLLPSPSAAECEECSM